MRLAASVILALSGGLVLAACFGREPLSVASWFALSPLVALLGLRRAPLLGWLHGVAFWLGSTYWIRTTVQSYGHLPPWLAAVILILMAAYLGLFHALFAWLGAPLWRRHGATALLGLPALWVAIEWLRTFHLFNGFPWNLAAYAWAEVPGALPLTAWVGAYGISFLVVLVNVGVAFLLLRRGWRPALLAAGLTLLVLSAGARWGAAAPDPAGSGRPVRIVQPNTPIAETWDEAAMLRDYRKTFEMSRRACDAPGTLLIWPESAAWPFVYERDAGFRAEVGGLVGRGCPLLLNSITRTPAGSLNSALLVGSEGIAGRYDKRHLVPYGEYVPLAALLPFVGRLARGAGNYLPGGEPSLLPWEDEQIGAAICFEVIFPGEVADLVRRGATVLVTVTNDAWYGDTTAPWQHFRMARFRAAENRRPLLRAAITGVSGAIGPDGSVWSRLGVGAEGVLPVRVAGRRELTLYTRLPWLVPALCSLLAAFAILRARRS